MNEETWDDTIWDGEIYDDPDAPDPGKIVAWSFAQAVMRITTPSGPVPQDLMTVRRDTWRELVQEFGVEELSHDLIIDFTNIAYYLMDALVAATGTPAADWLKMLREDYVDFHTDDYDGGS